MKKSNTINSCQIKFNVLVLTYLNPVFHEKAPDQIGSWLGREKKSGHIRSLIDSIMCAVLLGDLVCPWENSMSIGVVQCGEYSEHIQRHFSWFSIDMSCRGVINFSHSEQHANYLIVTR